MELLKVLTIGNSFADSIFIFLPKIAEAAGYNLLLEKANIGGCSLKRHYEEYLKSRADETYKPYYGKFNLKEKLSSEKWDIITIQQASYDSWKSDSYEPYVQNIVKVIRQYAPQAEIIIQQTWSYRADSPKLKEWGISQKEMFEKLNPIRPIVEDFKELQEKCTEQHICKNLLYLGRKGKEDPSDLYEKEVEKISKVYKKFAKKHGLQEVLKESIETSEQEVSKAKDRLEKEATKYAFQMLFCVKEWNVETWIELIFLKFYRELEQNKPKLSFTEEGFMIALSNTETEPQNEEKETKESKEKGNAIATRRKWIGEQEKKWFEGNDTISCWKLKEAAVKSLVELEDEEKKMDLLNYRIALDKSKLKEMYWLILRSGERRKELEIEVGISDGGVQKRIKQETGKPKEISPFLACTLWNKSNFSFESVFQIQAEETTLQDAAVKNAYIEGLKEKTSRLIPPLKAVWENPEDDAFWYSPAIERSCTCICMEMYSMEKIRFTAEYASFLVEPLTIELPFSRVMYKIVQMAPEKALNIAKAAGYTTTWEYLKYCAEMMVRKYCNIYFDIPYAKFQEIKQFAKIKVFIKPMILRTPDGKRMVEYMSCFKKNKGEIYSIPREVVGRLADFTWETEEALREDWEQIKENIKAIVIEECKQWNKEAGEFSEFSMSQEDFFEYIFDQEEVVDESICEKEVLHWDLPDWPF